MSTSATTGFCRVTVVAPDSRIDVALPEDVPLADIYPEVLRLSGQTQAEGAPTGFHLVRRDGTVLDSSLPLQAQQIRDGELLSLRPFAESLAPAVYDDVADAIASGVAEDRSQWGPTLMRGAGLIGGAVVLLLLAFALWFSDLQHDMHSLPGLIAGLASVVLIAIAGARARVYEDRGAALALGMASLPLAMLGGTGVVAPAQGEGPGRVQFLVGCIAVLLAATLLAALLPNGDAPFVAAALVSGVGMLATLVGILTNASAREVAAGSAVVAVGLVGFLPSLSSRFARLPVGFQAPQQRPSARGGENESRPALDLTRIALQARRGHELLVGMVGGCAAVVLGSSVVLAFTYNTWTEVLALTLGVSTMLRARLFTHTSQVMCLLVAGLGSLALLVVGLALHMPLFIFTNMRDTSAVDIRTLVLAVGIAAGAAILVSIALVVPKKGVSPFWGRILDMVDGLTLAALVPIALAVLDVYGTVRGLTS
ncbi:type VII secretion integral membrane protein EccD [Streptacidiphilus melanogenes]|uniref:type VII secretion integral membrane protein EccD n=1 Tax=Streptacidiphilus melanogenes TaxID=411235 RepID=UPI0005AA9A05|nr:type VII secretion integral membrane protein EccD [Streptacidiphilus melanogenes]